MKTFLKMLFEIGPLLVFFISNAYFGIFIATATFMVLVVLAVAGSRLILGETAIMPLITAGFVMVFGGLTLYLQDEVFIKLKPTLLYVLFAVILLGGLWSGRVFLKMLMEEALQLTDIGWQKLTYRWSAFFLAMAALNEVIWRNFSTDTWVSFKVFGFLPLTFAFAIIQMVLINRYAITDESEQKDG
jgi:intracellular septation protein